MPRTRVSLLMIAVTFAAMTAFFLVPFTPRMAVHTVTAERGDLLRTLTLEGTVEYRHQQTCAALNAGVVEAVYVRPGQQVKKGDLLFALDASAQMEMLALWSKGRYAQQQAAEWMTVWQSDAGTERELRAQIEGSRIRADVDGVVRAVYVEKGDMVAEAGLLGVISGEEKCVSALACVQEVQGIDLGSAAILTKQGQSSAATLSSLGAPVWSTGLAQSSQRLTLLPLYQEALADAGIGESIQTELLVQCLEDVTLIPIGAVDKQGQIWVVENGKAAPLSIDTTHRNESYVAGDSALAGARLILAPDECALWAGCPVKEARSR